MPLIPPAHMVAEMQALFVRILPKSSASERVHHIATEFYASQGCVHGLEGRSNVDAAAVDDHPAAARLAPAHHRRCIRSHPSVRILITCSCNRAGWDAFSSLSLPNCLL